MRDLESINSQFLSLRKFGFACFLPFMMGLIGSSFADDAAPNTALGNNYLSMFGLVMSIFSVFFGFIPFLFKWDWKTKYFGFPLFCVGSVSGSGLFPFLAIVIYGAWPLWVKLLLLIANIVLIVWWCRRFVVLYRKIHHDQKLWNQIYVEEEDAVYYLQRGDKKVIEKQLKFTQIPSIFFWIVPMLFALLLIAFKSEVVNFVGVPFPNIFLSIFSIPIYLMCLGLATRGFLIFYYYPWKIKRQTGKDVYVDMVSSHKDFTS